MPKKKGGLQAKFFEAYKAGDNEAAIKYLKKILDSTYTVFEHWDQHQKKMSPEDIESVLNSLGVTFMALAELYLRQKDPERAIYYAVKACSFPDTAWPKGKIGSTHQMASLILDKTIPGDLISQIKYEKIKEDLDEGQELSQPMFGHIDWTGFDAKRVVELYMLHKNPPEPPVEAGEPAQVEDETVKDGEQEKPKSAPRTIEIGSGVLATKWVKDESGAFVEINESTQKPVGKKVVVRRAKKKSPKHEQDGSDDWISLNDRPLLLGPSPIKVRKAKKEKHENIPELPQRM